MSTVVARLHAAITKPGPRLLPMRIVLSFEDAVALDELIAELCPIHIRCEDCGDVACAEHGIGEPSECYHLPLCANCWPGRCQTCQDIARADRDMDEAERTWRNA